MKNNMITVLTALLVATNLTAQVKIMDVNFTPTGISNEGTVVGYYEQTSPYYLWNPESGNTTEIGGVSAGNGVGGMAKFSADGKYISGTMYNDLVFPKDWKKTTITERDFTFTGFAYPAFSRGLAIGKDPVDPAKGIILSTSNGQAWKDVVKNVPGGLEDICFASYTVGFVGGQNGYFAYTTDEGQNWSSMTPRPSDNTDQVIAYHTIDFIQEDPYVGVVGAELADGKYAVYQSPDGAETWQTTTGVNGIPLDITHIGDTFYMVTKNGYIQKSTDNGLTWIELFRTGGFLQPIDPLFKIKFADENVGIALTKGYIYRSTNGGTAWSIVQIEAGVTDNTTWNDILWIDARNAIIVGTKGMAYTSADAGATWTKMDVESDGITDLVAIGKVYNQNESLTISGIHGNFYWKSLADKMTVAEMGRYDVAAGKWMALGGLGLIRDGISLSSGYAISGDGKTVVGLAGYQDESITINSPAHSHAVAWNEEKGMIDLGSLYTNIGRSTRANAVNYDGSVIVGWQDQRGPWYSAVWRKNQEGTYNKNEYLLVDPDGNSQSDLNRITQCNSISQNGRWIGGQGMAIAQSGPLSIIDDDQAIRNQPWIWSEATGIKRLGMIPELMDNGSAVGTVTGVNDEGTKATGFIVVGNMMYPFLWTADKGIQNLNDYIAAMWGPDLKDRYQFCSVLSMSPNSRHLAGWGIVDGQSLCAFTVDLDAPSTVETISEPQQVISVYPNPATDLLHLDFSGDVNAQIRLLDVQGRVILSENMVSVQNTISLEGVSAGFYILDVMVEGIHKTFKVEVSH